MKHYNITSASTPCRGRQTKRPLYRRPFRCKISWLDQAGCAAMSKISPRTAQMLDRIGGQERYTEPSRKPAPKRVANPIRTQPEIFTDLLRANITLLHHATPFVDLMLNIPRELGGAHIERLRALACDLRFQIRGLEDRLDLLVQSLNQRSGQCGRRHDAPPIVGGITGH